MNILFLGDIVGSLGRQTVAQLLPKLKQQLDLNLVLANAENLAGGRGVTADTIDELLQIGVDYLTSGNHVFQLNDTEKILAEESMRILRPANYPEDIPGRGWVELEEANLILINLIGRTFMSSPASDPFRKADQILDQLKDTSKPIVVDFHAEATSEKQALGFYLDGRVSAVIGTHTHVPSADARILPRGTGFVTDAGMVGAKNSVLGVAPETIIAKLKFPQPQRFKWVKKGPAVLQSILVNFDEKGQTTKISRQDYELPLNH